MASSWACASSRSAGAGRRPRQGDEGRLALVERGAAVAAGAGGAEAESRRHRQHRVADRWADRHGLVAVALVVPHAGLRPVLEDGHHVGHHLDVALDAGGQPQEGARWRRRRRGAAVVGAPIAVRHGLHHEQVLHEQPAARGVPRGLEHHGPRDVAPLVGHLGARWARSGSCRPCGPGGRRRRWASPAGAGTTTRPSRPGPRDSCSRSPRGTRSRRWGESSRLSLQRLRSPARC